MKSLLTDKICSICSVECHKLCVAVQVTRHLRRPTRRLIYDVVLPIKIIALSHLGVNLVGILAIVMASAAASTKPPKRDLYNMLSSKSMTTQTITIIIIIIELANRRPSKRQVAQYKTTTSQEASRDRQSSKMKSRVVLVAG